MRKVDTTDKQLPSARPIADFNLLPVLRALIDTGSITRTGELLELSQPAASRAVARLRRQLGDPLLVRTSKGYRLTPFAESLKERVDAALEAAGQVFKPAGFDASSSVRKFCIATTDYGALAVLPAVASAIALAAPQATVSIDPWGEATMVGLERGDLDLALYADEALPPDFHTRDLFRETYVLIARRGHPVTRAGKRSLLERAAAFPQVVARYPSGRHFASDDVLTRMGAPAHHVALALPYFAIAPMIVEASDLVMVLPRRVADRLSSMARVVALPLGPDSPAFTYRMIWHERMHRDAGHQWLRQRVLEAMS
jgi:DNA-binding transcriptional LysR family regulator